MKVSTILRPILGIAELVAGIFVKNPDNKKLAEKSGGVADAIVDALEEGEKEAESKPPEK